MIVLALLIFKLLRFKFFKATIELPVPPFKVRSVLLETALQFIILAVFIFNDLEQLTTPVPEAGITILVFAAELRVKAVCPVIVFAFVMLLLERFNPFVATIRPVPDGEMLMLLLPVVARVNAVCPVIVLAFTMFLLVISRLLFILTVCPVPAVRDTVVVALTIATFVCAERVVPPVLELRTKLPTL